MNIQTQLCIQAIQKDPQKSEYRQKYVHRRIILENFSKQPNHLSVWKCLNTLWLTHTLEYLEDIEKHGIYLQVLMYKSL